MKQEIQTVGELLQPREKLKDTIALELLCGSKGLVASLQLQDAGLILARHSELKDLALPQL